VNAVTFTTADVLTPVTFLKGISKTLNIVANVISPLPAQGTTLRWTIPASDANLATADTLRTTGVISGVIAESAGGANITRVNIGATNEGGTYTMRSNVLEVKKSASSPSGTISRGTFADAALFDLESKGANANLGVDALVFATDSLPAGLVASVTATGALNDAVMFRLYDVDGGIAIPATRFLNVAGGTIAFSGIPNGALTVTFGQVRHIALQITTTDQAKWVASTSMRWAVGTQASAIVGARGTAVAATDPDFGGGVNFLTVPQVTDAAGSIMKSGGAGAAYVAGTDEVLLLGPNAAAVVAIGDIRLAIGLDAARGLGFTPGSIVAAGDADIGTAHNAPQVTDAAGSILKNGGANGDPAVYGTNAVYNKTTAVGGDAFDVQATDVRVAFGTTIPTGLNWQGGIGFGGATYGVPAVANTIVLP
jgi:hypothetical protein